MKFTLAQAPAMLKLQVAFCQYLWNFIVVVFFLINFKIRINQSDQLKIALL